MSEWAAFEIDVRDRQIAALEARVREVEAERAALRAENERLRMDVLLTGHCRQPNQCTGPGPGTGTGPGTGPGTGNNNSKGRCEVSEQFSPTTDPVYTGRNEIRINQATMNRIVLEWLHVNHSGGPYRVINVEQSVAGASNTFIIDFEDAPVKKGEGAALVARLGAETVDHSPGHRRKGMSDE